ncbi:hypothetical protein [Anaerotignum propionicum]|uniref:hypothetical protein n=1 Tax=Anaerotignum propionicum TaxID=28446 RepID=UPI0028A1A08B|nr:hypothetical protein [Anaerotignum propionicum]
MNDNSSICNSNTKEYIEVKINYKLYPMCIDCYHAFGWEDISTIRGITSVKLRLTRSKKIKNRVELCKLQRECEDALMGLERLLNLQNMKYIRVACVISTISILFSLITLITCFLRLFLLSVILSCLSVIGLGSIIFIHNKYIRIIKKEYVQEINEYYDKLYYLCNKAEQLI